MASQTYNSINSYISQYSNIVNTLGLGVYNGLLSNKVVTNVTRAKESEEEIKPVIHSENTMNDYYDKIGVYYNNFTTIQNTLNRNIGGNGYTNSGYDILSEGSEIGQRESILFGIAERKTPLFLSDYERDRYVNYIDYISNNYGAPSYLNSNALEESNSGYTIGVKRGYEIGNLPNANDEDNDTLLGKLSCMALSNIVNTRNIRKKNRGFQSITNINYYDKGRTDIEDGDKLEALDSAVGISSDEGLPNFGIKKDYAFIGFGNVTLEYSYSSATQNYSMFDRWGDLINGDIALNNSPAYNSIKKSATYNGDGGTLYMSANPTIDMSRYLIRNLKFKNGYNTDESISTYMGMHGFGVSLNDAKNRYKLYIGSMAETNAPHINFHYDEGKLDSTSNSTANDGINYGKFITSNSTSSAYGKDLAYITNNAFRNGKYQTMISRFASQVVDDATEKETQTAISKYGLSHGRNLLRVKNLDKDNVTVKDDPVHGYTNPYCRTWTYHHQYSKLCNAIRPFTKENNDGTCDFSDIRTKEEIARYRNSRVNNVKEVTTNPAKLNIASENNSIRVISSEGQELLQTKSVLNRYNGLVNITPTNSNDDGETATTVKDCMFSIENLAWKDVKNGTNNCNLSKEQRGPFGGRIMWFPPYGLTFSENVSTNWNTQSFIGRGENIYTYANTERSGNLSFCLLIDHPSVVNNWRVEKKGTTQDVDDVNSTEQKILRFFAGCALLSDYSGEDYTKSTKKEPIATPLVIESTPVSFSFIVYFPNDYSGIKDGVNKAIPYLLNGYGVGGGANYIGGVSTDTDDWHDILNYEYSSDNGASYHLGGYEMHTGNDYGITGKYYQGKKLFQEEKGHIVEEGTRWVTSWGNGDKVKSHFMEDLKVKKTTDNNINDMTCYYLWNETPSKKTNDYQHSWGYRYDRIEEEYFKQNLTVSKTGVKYNNYMDVNSYGLNGAGYNNSTVAELYPDLLKDENAKTTFSFADVFAALEPSYADTVALKEEVNSEHVQTIKEFLKNGVTEIEIEGSASQQGVGTRGHINNEKGDSKDTLNNNLSTGRAAIIKQWLKNCFDENKYTYKTDENKEIVTKLSIKDRSSQKMSNTSDTNDLQRKACRCAIITVHCNPTKTEDARDTTSTEYINDKASKTNLQVSTKSIGDIIDGSQYVKDGERYIQNNYWEGDNNSRYDNESYFFQNLKVTDPFLHHRIVDKFKYFDPVFHSITPEGFGARLTFLQQCTRQGNTIGSSDLLSSSAGNLAFGRPPVCVLRIGDFYYTRIIINSLNITYENGNGIQWDLNHEGIGVMPMYAKIDINFKFIGGSDLNGPINRLQNAISFNYYANTRVYDNRSDKVEYSSENLGEATSELGKPTKITPWIPEYNNTENK